MTRIKFNMIVTHIWRHREYLRPHQSFDFPFYGGLKSRMKFASPEVVDAMQNIWDDFTKGTYSTKAEFRKAYLNELIRIGEPVK